MKLFFAAALALAALTANANAIDIVKTYNKKTKHYSCYMKKSDLMVCGNWKILK